MELVRLLTFGTDVVNNLVLRAAKVNLGFMELEPDFSVDGEFVQWLFRVSFSLGGGIAIILVAFGAYNILLSGGEPAKIQEGKEQITNALLGFVMILVSATIFNILAETFKF